MYSVIAAARANKLYHLNRISATCFFLSLRTNCSNASSSSISDTNAKVVYSVASALAHNMDDEAVKFKSRVPVITNALEIAKLSPEVYISPEFRGSEISQLQHIRSATMEDITSVHSNSYLFRLDLAIQRAAEGEFETGRMRDFSNVTLTTLDDSLVAAGAGLSVIDSVVATSKISKNPPVGFALIEPPKHHTHLDGGKGFCVFDNVAIAARYAQRVHGLKRVFIVDFDAHHVNETNGALYDDPDIFFLSTHEDTEYYSHMGKFDDIGRGNGERSTLNVPLPAGSGDMAIRTVFDEVIVPSVQRFKPDIILVSAGYDGHAVDPTCKLQLTTASYYMLASGIKQLAKNLCGGRCVFILAGGYNQGILSFSVAESFRAFLEEPSISADFEKKYAAFLQYEPSRKVTQVIQKIKNLHSI